MSNSYVYILGWICGNPVRLCRSQFLASWVSGSDLHMLVGDIWSMCIWEWLHMPVDDMCIWECLHMWWMTCKEFAASLCRSRMVTNRRSNLHILSTYPATSECVDWTHGCEQIVWYWRLLFFQYRLEVSFTVLFQLPVVVCMLSHMCWRCYTEQPHLWLGQTVSLPRAPPPSLLSSLSLSLHFKNTPDHSHKSK